MLLSYLVVSGAGLVLSGQLADCLELAPVFRVGLGAFAVSGLALAVSGEPMLFIAARALQGAGAALLLSTAAAIITVSHPTARRRSAMGVYLAGFSIAQVSGPMIGGVVTSTVGWRWLFLIGFVIAVGALVFGWVPLARLPRRGFTGLRVDLAGNALIVVVTSVVLVAFAGVQPGRVDRQPHRGAAGRRGGGGATLRRGGAPRAMARDRRGPPARPGLRPGEPRGVLPVRGAGGSRGGAQPVVPGVRGRRPGDRGAEGDAAGCRGHRGHAGRGAGHGGPRRRRHLPGHGGRGGDRRGAAPRRPPARRPTPPCSSWGWSSWACPRVPSRRSTPR